MCCYKIIGINIYKIKNINLNLNFNPYYFILLLKIHDNPYVKF